MNRIKDKVEEILNYTEELEKIIPDDLGTYINNFEKRAACERYFEKIVESIVDLAHLTIKYKNLKIPSEDVKAFDILFENKIIKDDLRTNLKNAKGMRNILAHEYGKTDDELVFESVTQEILKHSKEFIHQIEKTLN